MLRIVLSTWQRVFAGLRTSTNSLKKPSPSANNTSTLGTKTTALGAEMFKYIQSTGKIYLDGALIGSGYSGAPEYKNQPEHQGKKNLGCIPCGVYTILPAFKGPKGPVCMRLIPDPSNEMFGRSGFMIHGDSKDNPGTASEGCIILPRGAREFINDKRHCGLRVVVN